MTGARARGSAALALCSPPPPGGLTEPYRLHGPRDSVLARNPPRLTACRALLPGEWEGRRRPVPPSRPQCWAGTGFGPRLYRRGWGVLGVARFPQGNP